MSTSNKKKQNSNPLAGIAKPPVSSSLFYQKVEKLVNEWKEKELGKTAPYSPEAEIEAGFRIFLRWLRERDVQ